MSTQRETHLTISGMTCGSCVRRVQRALSNMSGVESVEVSLDDGEAHVVHDAAIDGADLAEAVGRIGYGANTKRR
jgi:copper chaperone CopZ